MAHCCPLRWVLLGRALQAFLRSSSQGNIWWGNFLGTTLAPEEPRVLSSSADPLPGYSYRSFSSALRVFPVQLGEAVAACHPPLGGEQRREAHFEVISWKPLALTIYY
jgi:hypothetical protein